MNITASSPAFAKKTIAPLIQWPQQKGYINLFLELQPRFVFIPCTTDTLRSLTLLNHSIDPATTVKQATIPDLSQPNPWTHHKMKFIMGFLLSLLVILVSTVASQSAGDSSSVHANTTLTGTYSSLNTATPPNDLPSSPVPGSGVTTGPYQHATHHCNQSITTTTSWIKQYVTIPAFVFKTITVYTTGTTSCKFTHKLHNKTRLTLTPLQLTVTLSLSQSP